MEQLNMKPPKDDDDYERFRPLPLWVILICGLIVFFSGLYLSLSNMLLKGVTLPNGRFGRGGGNPVSMNGYGLVIIGILMCAFPVFELIKRKIRKRP